MALTVFLPSHTVEICGLREHDGNALMPHGIVLFARYLIIPQKRGNMFSPALVCVRVCVCVCLCVCLSVTTITKKIVDEFAPNFMRRFLGGKERPSSCFVTIGTGMWKQWSERIMTCGDQ